MIRRWVVLALRVVLAAVFLYAAYTKLRQPWMVFAMSIDAYGLLPEFGVLAIARTLPWIELALGLLLLAGIWLRAVSVMTAAILGVFFAIMVMSFGKGMGIDCGCFGVGEPLTAKTLFRDGSLLVGAIALSILSWQTHPRQTLA
jgi:uncharacterized membrane protein YphA (DoxX/SURF4 family)